MVAQIDGSIGQIPPGPADTLARLRAARRFDPAVWLEAAQAVLLAYLRRHGLRAVVLGLSGGIDSAVALGLLARCAVTADGGSPLAGEPPGLLVAALPLQVEGATGQQEGLERARLVAAHFGVELIEAELGPAHAALVEALAGEDEVDAWTRGQLVSTLRSPALYFLAARSIAAGRPALVVGTINRDEGSWIGFFGKTSDAAVDLQLLGDLHKSEVRQVAHLLGIPEPVLQAAPAGGVWDGASDADMIGCQYDVVELVTGLRGLSAAARSREFEAWSPEDRVWFEAHRDRLMARHSRNAHKYLAGGGLFLDVLERAVPGGWRPPQHPVRPVPAAQGGPQLELASLPASASPRSGPKARENVDALEPSKPARVPLARCAETVIDMLAAERPRRPDEALATVTGRVPVELPDLEQAADVVEGLLDPAECALLRDVLSRLPRTPVGVDGQVDGATPESPSWRVHLHDERLAAVLWERLEPHLPVLRHATPYGYLDPPAWLQPDDAPALWRPVGLNPRIRVLGGEPGAWLVPHYDAGYDFGDGRCTLVSLLIYLNGASRGGTVLLSEPARQRPLVERVFADRAAPARPSDRLATVLPSAGRALWFDHRLPHAADPWAGPGSRMVLRTDVVFVRAGAALLPTTPEPAAREPVIGPGTEGALTSDVYYRSALPLLRRHPWRPLAESEPAQREGSEDERLLQAIGWFPDEEALPAPTLEEPLGWPLTPLAPLQRGLAAHAPLPADRVVVLLATGALWPPHEGHRALLEAARAELEAAGEVVVAGYLAPDHDAYLRAKNGPDTPIAVERLEAVRQLLGDCDWIGVDPWLARCASGPLGFTRAVARLETLLNRLVPGPTRLEVVSVVGGDNARLALAHAARGRCVVVPRPGAEDELERLRAHPLYASAGGRLRLAGTSGPALSSSALRGEDPRTAEPARGSSGTLWLRDEGAFAWEGFARGRDRAVLAAAWADFVAGLRDTATQLLAPGGGAVALFSLEEQRQRLADEEPALSLDPCLPGACQLALSRCFLHGAATPEPDLVARPGSPALAQQLAALPPGSYWLRDDDSITGRTFEQVRALLPDHVELRGTRTAAPELDGDVLDLCDCRDFLPGARAGGLVLRLPGLEQPVRAPYLMPWVRPAERASLPIRAERSFSEVLWSLAAAFYERLEPAPTVAEADPAFRDLALWIGFYDTTPLATVCRWHARRLARP